MKTQFGIKIVFVVCVVLCAGVLIAQDTTKKETATDQKATSKTTSKTEAKPLRILIMDPLSAPLACDCVQGYAQRKYEELGKFVVLNMKTKVKIIWSESFESGLKKLGGEVDLVIGKHSVVTTHAKQHKVDVKPVAQLTDKDGSTTQTGLIVVRKNDEAIAANDLKGYRIFFGPKDCDEKHKAPIAFIKEMGGEVPAKIETSGACSEAATKLLELDKEIKAAAIISSYAKPLLEGCGTINKGDLRVIGETDEVHFITAFVNKKLDAEISKKLVDTLLKVGGDVKLVKALETDTGFVEFEELKKETKDKKETVKKN